MKRLLIAAGIAGLAYYLKRNPQKVTHLKNAAKNAVDKVKAKAGAYNQ